MNAAQQYVQCIFHLTYAALHYKKNAAEKIIDFPCNRLMQCLYQPYPRIGLLFDRARVRFKSSRSGLNLNFTDSKTHARTRATGRLTWNAPIESVPGTQTSGPCRRNAAYIRRKHFLTIQAEVSGECQWPTVTVNWTRSSPICLERRVLAFLAWG